MQQYPVSRSNQTQAELYQVPSPKPPQPVHQSLPTAAVFSYDSAPALAAAAYLPVGQTDAYIAALNALPIATDDDDASDTSGVLARAHGYDDTMAAQLSSYAMPQCMLCEVSGQPDNVIFSHDTHDPYCPSYYSDDEEEDDHGGGGR